MGLVMSVWGLMFSVSMAPRVGWREAAPMFLRKSGMRSGVLDDLVSVGKRFVGSAGIRSGVMFVMSTIFVPSSLDRVGTASCSKGKVMAIAIFLVGNSGKGLFALPVILGSFLFSSATSSATSCVSPIGRDSLNPRFSATLAGTTGLALNKWNPKPVSAVAGKSSLAIPSNERKERSRADGRQSRQVLN